MATKHPLQRLLESAEVEVIPYSGRAMYGKQCLATVASGVLSKLVEACLYQGEYMVRSDKQAIVDAMRQVRTDSLGHDTVTYFPNVEHIDEDEDMVDEFQGEDPSAVAKFLLHTKAPRT